MVTKKRLVDLNRTADRRSFAADLLMVANVFHNDGVAGEAADIADQGLKHGRVSNVLQHCRGEAQIDRIAIERQMCAVDLREFDIPIRAQIALGNVINRLRNVGPEDKTGAVAGRDVSQICHLDRSRPRLSSSIGNQLYPGTGVGTLIACRRNRDCRRLR
jgi:hypothetical protein